MIFKVNQGLAERILRVIIGFLLLAYAMYGMQTLVKNYTGTWQQWALFILSAMMLLSGLSGVCPAYAIVGMATGKGWICPTCTDEERAELRAFVEEETHKT